MSYPYEFPAIVFQDLIKPLSDLAYTTQQPFDSEFSTRLPIGKAYHFDKIKERVCVYRKDNLASADAFLVGEKDSEPWYYFIEFKNQDSSKIDKKGLAKKAFDSLSILSMTFGHSVPMRELQNHSSFIVVYPNKEYSIRFTETLNACAYGQPLLGLDKFAEDNIYADIKVVHDGTFATMSLPYMV